AAGGGHRYHREIEDVVFHALQYLGRVAGLHRDLQAWHAILDRSEDRRQQVDAGSRPGSDAQPPDRAAAMKSDRLHRLMDIFLDAADMNQQIGACRCRMCSASDALDQADTEMAFELPDLQADSRLTDAGPIRGGGETAELDHVSKGTELLEAGRFHQ